jgi:hypothetical protein
MGFFDRLFGGRKSKAANNLVPVSEFAQAMK